MVMNHRVGKKNIAIIVMLLLIGVAATPGISLSVVKAHNSDLVEVTSQAFGIQGIGITTLRLTTQQHQDLVRYLVYFQSRLNQTTTREEAVSLYKEVIATLNAYGLLPKGMTLRQAQRMVSLGYHVPYPPKHAVPFTQDSINCCCLFSGIFQGAYDDNIFSRIATWIYNHMNPYVPPIWPWIVYGILLTIGWVKALRFMNMIDVYGDVDSFFSIGLYGIKSGHYDITRVIGFTGMKIILDLNGPAGYALYLGFALDIS